MKAKELLKEIVKSYSDIVAIAQDEDKCVYFYSEIPKISVGGAFWYNIGFAENFTFPKIIEWDSKDWKENIITINDLKDELN